jgi:hypothetical protein
MIFIRISSVSMYQMLSAENTPPNLNIILYDPAGTSKLGVSNISLFCPMTGSCMTKALPFIPLKLTNYERSAGHIVSAGSYGFAVIL